MAKTQKPHYLTAIVLLFSLLISQSSARQLHGYLPQSLEVIEPEASIGIVLPSDKVEALPQKFKQQPCHEMKAKQNSEMGINSVSYPKLAGKYHPLVLNILPKGTPVPPSGPSNGINDVNN